MVLHGLCQAPRLAITKSSRGDRSLVSELLAEQVANCLLYHAYPEASKTVS